MSFRQFPATDSQGESHIILEFKDEQAQGAPDAQKPRYELYDGRHLQRVGREFVTAGGELRLSI